MAMDGRMDDVEHGGAAPSGAGTAPAPMTQIGPSQPSHPDPVAPSMSPPISNNFVGPTGGPASARMGGGDIEEGGNGGNTGNGVMIVPQPSSSRLSSRAGDGHAPLKCPCDCDTCDACCDYSYGGYNCDGIWAICCCCFCFYFLFLCVIPFIISIVHFVRLEKSNALAHEQSGSTAAGCSPTEPEQTLKSKVGNYVSGFFLTLLVLIVLAIIGWIYDTCFSNDKGSYTRKITTTWTNGYGEVIAKTTRYE